MITSRTLTGNAEEEQQPRAKLIRKDGQVSDYGTIQLGTKTIEQMEKRTYVYSGEREGHYRIFREQ